MRCSVRKILASHTSNGICVRPSYPRASRNASVVTYATSAIAPPRSARSGAADGDILDCVIVGGGISGLITAQALSAEHPGVNYLLTEGRDRVGGNLTTCTNDDGYLWEEGPNSFQPSDAMLKAAVDAGIDDELVLGDPTAPRFVLWGGELLPTPSGPDVVTFKLLTLWGKLRAGLGAVGIKKPMPDNEESVKDFVTRNLGTEVFQRLIEPFCSGVYAGNPSKLSMKAAFGKVYALEKAGGSIIAGVIKSIQAKKGTTPPVRDARLPPKPSGQTVGSFRKGLQSLPRAIAAKHSANIRVEWKLTGISKKNGSYELKYDTPDGSRTLKSHCVALTVPAYAAANILQVASSKTAESLREFDYPPVGAVSISYPMSAIREDRKDAAGKLPGFGQLHPRSQNITTLGTLYSSSLFPGRAPEGRQLLLNYIGGALNRGIVDQSDEELVAQVDQDLRTMLIKPTAERPQVLGVKVWPQAIPQFNIGHLDVLDEAKRHLSDDGLDGIILGGNYVAGVALGKCVEFGYDMAGDVAKYVKTQNA